MLQSKVLNFFGFLRCLSLVCLIFPIVLTTYLFFLWDPLERLNYVANFEIFFSPLKSGFHFSLDPQEVNSPCEAVLNFEAEVAKSRKKT